LSSVSSSSGSSSSSSSGGQLASKRIEGIAADVHGTLVFGTVSGRIGVVARLTESQFYFLLQLQTSLNSVIKSVGDLSHDEWRSFHNDRRYTTKESKSKHFIDGDIIEKFLDLDKTLQEKVAVLMSKNMIPVGITSTEANTEIRDVSVDTLIHIVEDLSRIH
jgi:hypothetical protein|tara:strand:- start:188 stop:673 length:486 start_codon:yes stop_codon:yes gene_type:complete